MSKKSSSFVPTAEELGEVEENDSFVVPTPSRRKSPSPTRRAQTAPARAGRGATPHRKSSSPVRKAPSPTRRAASPARAGRLGPGGEGNYVIAPNGHAIVVYSSRGGQLTEDYGKTLQKLLDDGDVDEAWLANARRHSSALAANEAEGNSIRAAHGPQQREKMYFYNAATNKITKKDPSRAVVGGASTLHGPYPTLEAASAGALKINPNRKSKLGAKVLRTKKDGSAYKEVDHSATKWVYAGKPFANGARRPIVYKGSTWNELVAAGAKVDGVLVKDLVPLSNAQKLSESEDKSSARRPSSGKSKEELKADKIERLAGARAKAKALGPFLWCITNPNTNTSIGVVRANGSVGAKAKAVAHQLGLKAGATDEQVVAFLEKKLDDKVIKPGKGKKCGKRM